MSSAASKLINPVRLKSATAVVRACAHPLRLKLLAYIHNKRKTNVNAIYRTLKIEQSVTSSHLKILKEANFVISQRVGKLVYYTVNYKQVKKIADILEKHF